MIEGDIVPPYDDFGLRPRMVKIYEMNEVILIESCNYVISMSRYIFLVGVMEGVRITF